MKWRKTDKQKELNRNMPIYRYVCQCGKQFDEFRKVDNRHDYPLCVCGELTQLKIMPTSVQADIQPYRTAVVDKESGKLVNIESRAQHKEFLRRNDYVEVGNDWKPPTSRNDGPADAPMLSVDEMKKQGFHEESF